MCRLLKTLYFFSSSNNAGNVLGVTFGQGRDKKERKDMFMANCRMMFKEGEHPDYLSVIELKVRRDSDLRVLAVLSWA